MKRGPYNSKPGPLQTQVLSLLAGGPMSCTQLMAATYSAWNVMNQSLRRLEQRGRVVKSGPHKAVLWSLPSEPERASAAA
jgi:DNA-binding HxlR family transcriptional regulator